MLIIAHRGASHDAPENTLAAARLAWTQGADGLECDVQLTQDGKLAVIHDDDLRRVAGSPLRVAELTMEALREHGVGGWKGEAFVGEKVPALDELLAVLPPGKRIFIELKNGAESVPELVRCLARSRLNPAQVAIISFHLEAVVAAKKALPRCEVCWILDEGAAGGRISIDGIVARCREANLDGLDLEARWTAETGLAEPIRAAGLRLYVWTVDDDALAKKLVNQGVEGIATNRPGWLRERLRK